MIFKSTENEIAERDKEPDSVIIKVKGLFSYLIKKWWLFLLAGILAGSAGFFMLICKNPCIKSKLTFALDEGWKRWFYWRFCKSCIPVRS